ncbi:MAG: group I truncated hemoglobin [Armatimonadota bacterium]
MRDLVGKAAGILGLLALVTLLLPNAQIASAAPKRSLYDRLGGKTAITAVVDEFVANVAADKRINKFFAKTNIPRLKQLLVDQICEASGGPCKYTGRSMKESHKGMGVADKDWDALVEDLVKALNKFKVPKQEQQELLGLLGPMKKDIVEKM